MERLRAWGTAAQQVSAVLLGVAITSGFFDSSWYLVLTTIAFAFVYSKALRLFDELAASAGGANFPYWFRSVFSVAVGAGLGAAPAWLPDVDVVRFTALMVMAVILAWVLAAWRQRWGEGRVYRGTLVEMVADPKELDA